MKWGAGRRGHDASAKREQTEKLTHTSISHNFSPPHNPLSYAHKIILHFITQKTIKKYAKIL
jgi:hypothetical protein